MTEKFKSLEQVEREQILLAMETFQNNKTQAAAALGITVKTLYNKLHIYGVFDDYKVGKTWKLQRVPPQETKITLIGGAV